MDRSAMHRHETIFGDNEAHRIQDAFTPTHITNKRKGLTNEITMNKYLPMDSQGPGAARTAAQASRATAAAVGAWCRPQGLWRGHEIRERGGITKHKKTNI